MLVLSRLMNSGRIWAMLLLLSQCGCADSASANRPQEEVPRGKIEDGSLLSEQYLRLGLPAYDKPWSAPDMAKALVVLDTIARKDPTQLPRYKSDRSGDVFSRITSVDNFASFRNRKLPLEVRLPQAIAFIKSSNEVMKLYLAAFLGKSIGGSEMIELMAAQLRGTIVMIELADELLPTIKKDDPNYKNRMAGFDTMKQGMAITITGCLLTLTEKNNYRVEERARLIVHMRETIPTIVAYLPPASRTEILTRLETMTKDNNLKELQPGLDKLYSQVQDAVKAKKAP